MQCLQKYVPENKPKKTTNAITNVIALYIIEFGNVLIEEDPSDLDDVDSIWYRVMSYDAGTVFEEILKFSVNKKYNCQF